MRHKINIRWKILIVVLIQLLFLLGMIGMKSYTLQYGEKILLKTAPVDPRSLFSGDYIMLNYDISVINLDSVETDIDYKKFQEDYYDGKYQPIQKLLQKVYVKLGKAEGDRFWKVISATYARPSPARGEVVITGREGMYEGWSGKHEIRLKYGIESFYMSEGTGLEIEKNMRDRNVESYVEIAVDRYGNAGISAVYQGEKRIS